jgi:dihydroxyacetone kinase-like protein
MADINSEQVVAWLDRFASLLATNKDYLTQLDSAIGDADHGANMDRGFQAVLKKRADYEGKDIGTIFKTVAMTLISTVGGASGPLYGTFFLQGSMAAAGKNSLTPTEFGELLNKATDGVVQRGKAALGDKTMIDALRPAVEAYRAAVSQGTDTRPAFQQAANAATEGMKATIPLVAKKGRASYLGERSADHQDPGATSIHLLFEAAAETLG